MNPTKREVLFLFLHEPSGALVHLDPRREGVVVPERLRTQHQLVLQIGLRFARPLRDLELTNEGFAATLSFSQKPFHCTIPWSAVFAIVPAGDRAPIVWRDDAPAEIRALLDAGTPRGAA